MTLVFWPIRVCFWLLELAYLYPFLFNTIFCNTTSLSFFSLSPTNLNTRNWFPVKTTNQLMIVLVDGCEIYWLLLHIIGFDFYINEMPYNLMCPMHLAFEFVVVKPRNLFLKNKFIFEGGSTEDCEATTFSTDPWRTLIPERA